MNLSRNELTDPARSPDKSGGFPTVPPTAQNERRESGQGRSDCPTDDEITPDDIRYLRAQAVWDDLGLGGL